MYNVGIHKNQYDDWFGFEHNQGMYNVIVIICGEVQSVSNL